MRRMQGEKRTLHLNRFTKVTICFLLLMLVSYAVFSTVNLKRLLTLPTERIDKAVGTLYGGTGMGQVFTINNNEHPELIDAMVEMFLRNEKDYMLFIPSLGIGKNDFSLSFFDTAGKELLTVYVRNLQDIRIGASTFRCKHNIDTQVFNRAHSVAIQEDHVQYPVQD